MVDEAEMIRNRTSFSQKKKKETEHLISNLQKSLNLQKRNDLKWWILLIAKN